MKKNSLLKFVLPLHLKKQSPLRTGGIFLRSSSLPTLPSQVRHHFFHSKPTRPPLAAIADKIRQDFLSNHHKHAQMNPLVGIDHVLIYLNGKLTLLGKNTRSMLDELETVQTPALEDGYITLKSISHLSVWLNLVLRSMIVQKEPYDSEQTELLQIQDHLLLLKSINDERLLHEHSVLNRLMKVTTQTLEATTTGQLQEIQSQFLLEMKQINERYSAQATELQLKGLHRITSNWVKQHNLLLETTRVLIVTPHDPREGSIEKQYFLDWYSKEGIVEAEEKTGHIICVEMLPEQMGSVSQLGLIDFLKGHQLNIPIGKDMLGDEKAMSKDILSAHAPPVLEKLCPFHSQKYLATNSVFSPNSSEEEKDNDAGLIAVFQK